MLRCGGSSPGHATHIHEGDRHLRIGKWQKSAVERRMGDGDKESKNDRGNKRGIEPFCYSLIHSDTHMGAECRPSCRAFIGLGVGLCQYRARCRTRANTGQGLGLRARANAGLGAGLG